MKKILIVKNIDREGPGLLESVLEESTLPSLQIDLSQGQSFPDPRLFRAVIVLGGPDSANDETKIIKQEIQKIAACVHAKIPYLGICLGMQMLVKALGGKIVQNHIKEIGFRAPNGHFFKTELTNNGKKDPLFQGLHSPLKVFQLHGETIIGPQDMILLGQGNFCKNQIIRFAENAYGIQCHFELTEEMFEVWRAQDTDLQKLNQEKLLSDFRIIQKEYTETGKRIFRNFLKLSCNL